jgi:hypothetical protein
MLLYCADSKGLWVEPYFSLRLYTGAIEHLAVSHPKRLQQRALGKILPRVLFQTLQNMQTKLPYRWCMATRHHIVFLVRALDILLLQRIRWLWHVNQTRSHQCLWWILKCFMFNLHLAGSRSLSASSLTIPIVLSDLHARHEHACLWI